MKLLLIFLLALGVAVVAAPYLAADPGFIVIGYGGKVVRTSFVVFLAVLAIGFITLLALLAVFRNLATLRGRLHNWSSERARRRAHEALTGGLVLMAGGDFAEAEKLFTSALDKGSQPEVYYLAAAEAAQAQHAGGRRDNYLALAREVKPELATRLDIKHAQWLLDSGDFAAAGPIIERLEKRTVGDPQVLNLRMRLAEYRGDHAALLGMVADLRRDHVLSHDAASALERDCAAALLTGSASDSDALKQRWRQYSRSLRASPVVISAYVRALCAAGADDEAETLLRKQIERAWDSSLVALYGEIQCEPPARQLRKLEAWSITRGDDPGLRLARARQAIRAGLWGQAREQIEALMAERPSPLLHQLLAEIAEGMDDAAAAVSARRAGLEMATGEHFTARLAAPSVAPTA